jgi:hypothetical protein
MSVCRTLPANEEQFNRIAVYRRFLADSVILQINKIFGIGGGNILLL